MRFIITLFYFFTTLCTANSHIYNGVPEQLNTQARYVFYSHGYIVEGTNPTPVHPRWGEYNYPGVLEALASTGAIVISEHRAKNTNPFDQANKLKQQVERLIASGIDPSHISLVGFSRGGFITAIASHYLNNPNLNFAILAACDQSLAANKDITLHGKLFTMFETSDSVGSCNKIVARAGNRVTEFEEVSISTGLEHGAFYRPITQWVAPVNRWLTREVNTTP